MSAKADSLNQYEAMFLLPSGAAADLDGALKLVRGIIEKHAGQVLLAKKWDERKLAYEMGKQKRGLYIITYFNAPGSAVAGIERDVNLGDTVLRVLVTQADHMNLDEMNAVEPQPIQPREERNPWDRPGFNDPPSFRDRPRRDDAARPPRRDDMAEAGANKD